MRHHRTRRWFVAMAALAVAAGLISRSPVQPHLPFFTAAYTGDTLWGLLIYLLAGACCPHRSPWPRVAAATAFAFAIELTQLYQAPWINELRSHRLAAMVLGHTFVWTDLVCYSVGIGVGLALERWGLARAKALQAGISEYR